MIKINPRISKFRKAVLLVIKIAPLGIISLLILGCKEPIELNFPASQPKLVVDGYISDVEKEHFIKLSFSSGFNADGISLQTPITDAIVEIVAQSGAVLPLTHEARGAYRTPMFQAKESESYKLIVRLEDETYESTFQSLPGYKTQVDVLYELEERQELSGQGVIVEKRGFQITATLDQTDKPLYYHWLQRNYHIAEAPNSLENPILFPNRWCYVRNFDRVQIDIHHQQANNPDGQLNIELDFYEPNGNQFHDAALEVIQLITNQESYNYWSTIKSASESVGSLFDPAPTSVQGNITSIDDTPALGFFGVYNESIKRLFYQNCELPLNYRRPATECSGDGLTELGRLTNPCYDCTLATGIWSQVEAPEWWRPIIPALGSDDRACALLPEYGGGG